MHRTKERSLKWVRKCWDCANRDVILDSEDSVCIDCLNDGHSYPYFRKIELEYS